MIFVLFYTFYSWKKTTNQPFYTTNVKSKISWFRITASTEDAEKCKQTNDEKSEGKQAADDDEKSKQTTDQFEIIYKEVKRPGKNYDRLLELLKELHGPADIRQQYIMDVIKEANRFKRNHMAQIIQQNMPNLVSIDS